MYSQSSDPIEALAKEFSKIPGVGIKSALRMAYFYISNKSNIPQLIKSLKDLNDNVENCVICNFITDVNNNPCKYCINGDRDKKLICILESSSDVEYIENSKSFNGVYHILGALISPINNINPNDIKLEKLKERLNKTDKYEILIATNFTTEGDATAIFIKNYLKEFPNISFSRLARGLPMGSNLEYIDSYTIGKAIEKRLSYDN
jgi:recombination protein RecR